MKKKTTLISMIALVVLMTACSSNNVGTSKDGGGQAASPNVKVDPFKMPNPIEVTTFKSLSPGAKLPAGDTVESNQ
jgi:putative aldouronate transport system substrate-binding protein